MTNVVVTIRLIIFWSAGIVAAKRIFWEMMGCLINAPINAFYDITPIGRILNRLSKD
jgi:hypothetical protein